MSNLVEDFEIKKSEILANEDLSQEGKRKEYEALVTDTKAAARGEISDLRGRAITTALSLRDAQRKRQERTGAAIENMDYSRLNYEAQTLRYKLEAVPSVEGAMVLWEEAKANKNTYELRAWKDLAAGIITSRGGSDYTGYKARLIEEIESANVEVIKDPELAAAEIEAMVGLDTIGREANAINDLFGSGDRAVLSRVMEGIEFDNGKVLLGFDYKYSAIPYSTDIRKESDQEVVKRLEQEYTERISEYNKELAEVGFDPLDQDFDDFRGAFVESE